MQNNNWTTKAACKGMPVNDFYPTGHGPAAVKSVRAALAVCDRCPVRRECLDDANALGDFYGIRGGLTGSERASMVRGRRIRICG